MEKAKWNSIGTAGWNIIGRWMDVPLLKNKKDWANSVMWKPYYVKKILIYH